MTPPRQLATPLMLGAAYTVAAGLTVALTRFDGGVAFLWVATSILAADLITRPRRQWLASILPCALGGAIVTGVWGLGWAMAAPFVVVNMGEAIVAALLFRHFAASTEALGSLRWLGIFVVAFGIVAPLSSGLMAAAAVSTVGLSPGQTFATFFAGHALGNLTFTPVALLMSRSNREAMFHARGGAAAAEAIGLLSLAAATAGLVFWQEQFPLLFLPMLPMILIAFRVGRGGVASSIAVLALIGGLATFFGHGPIQLIDATFGLQMQFFQLYLAATVLTLLPVSAELEYRRSLHAKMRESEAGYRLIADHSTDLILTLEVDGTIRYISPSCRQLGYDPTALIGTNSVSMVAPEHREEVIAAHRRSLDLKGETNRFEYLGLTASGERRWHETHARLIMDDDGKPDSVLSIVRDIEAQKTVERDLAQAALVDPLTGLNNRRAYHNALERRVGGETATCCVAMLDIDHFKAVNDLHGHEAGDEVLRGFAKVAKQVIRGEDIIARMGGEEFAIYFPDTRIEQALAICERLRSELSLTVFRAGQKSIRITVSGGVTEIGAGGIDEAMQQADAALYEAKAGGRNQFALAA